MLNTNYTSEILAAQKFINEHKDDIALKELLVRARSRNLIHSDRWSMIYDFITEYYPNEPSIIITGLTYSCET